MDRETILNKVKDICKNYFTAMDMGVTLINRQGAVLYQTPQSCGECELCRMTFGDANQDCSMSMRYGSYQAERFGGRYIYFCWKGFTHFASAVYFGGIQEYTLVGGPILMIDREEFFQEEILAKWYRDQNESYGVLKKDLWEALALVPYFSTEKVHSLSEMLYVCAEHLGETNTRRSDQYEHQKLQGIISDYIMRIKNIAEPGCYPLQKEQKLLDAVSQGDIATAKALLNELLGSIFFYSGFRFDMIRSRILELIVLLSRAAVKGGADAEMIFGLNYVYIHEIDNFQTIEDLTYWLSMIMSRFTDNVFHFAGVKHSDIIYKATAYIKTHYMDKITLDEVASAVYLSPPYFSKVFKEEVKCTFNFYLNKIRIEQSERLLLNQHISLADISNLVGYEDQSYFSKVFKKLTGLSPLKYRQARGMQ
ncbi:MAG: PocR ligand-binding domain-containing protein [Clostridiales bacterium]|jgi:AraC-like DNA-binding protein/ligand-binding sensor protein|nr:PocR ligand-binding domain-containing protein [Clostridiales bacterium]